MRLAALALFERADEILDLVRAEATLATRRAVRTQVTHIGPTPNGAQRNTELSRRLRRGETETIAGCDLSCRHVIS
jgi:hypothetical protein